MKAKQWTECEQYIDVMHGNSTYRCSFKHESGVSDDELAWMVSIAHKKYAVCSIIDTKTGRPVALASPDATIILQELERRLMPDHPRLNGDEMRRTTKDFRLERRYARERAAADKEMRRKLHDLERIITG